MCFYREESIHGIRWQCPIYRFNDADIDAIEGAMIQSIEMLVKLACVRIDFIQGRVCSFVEKLTQKKLKNLKLRWL
jgi:hypothetical protein